MAEDRRPLLIAGFALVGVGLYQLLTPPKTTPAPAPAPPPPGPAPPPPPSGGDYRVTASAGLRVHSAPSINAPVVGLLQYQKTVTIACQTTGDQVVRSNIWDLLSSPIQGYVSDWYISTPGVGVFSAGIPQCGSVPVIGPPTVLPPTGGGGPPPISDVRQVLPGWIIATGCAVGVADYLVVMAGGPPFGFGGAIKQKRWIVDGFTWSKLGVSRTAIRVVTPAVLNALPSGTDLRWGAARGQGLIWLNGAPQQSPTGNPAGYCT